MKKWEILSKVKVQGKKLKSDNLIKVLLQNRKIKTKTEISEFLNPKLKNVTVKSVGIDEKELKKSVERIRKSIKNSEQIIIYGDYDVDGISGSAILWETLSTLGAKILPYIPHRIDEGYGLSVKGIENLLSKIKDVKLIITVDNGIVANTAVDFANKSGIDIVITDHHAIGKQLPKAYSIVHTTRLCGAGVAYMLASEFKPKIDHLELVALATIADLVPLVGPSRILTKFGLERLRTTQRIGLLELFKEARLDKNLIGTYEVGHIIAPRLNAMGRLESAMDSLRLLCTKNEVRARDLARVLSLTNTTRQDITQKAVFDTLATLKVGKINGRLIFVVHESYQQGIIGLVAGKLVEEYYLPSIVVSKGDIYSKASARSISGFNIIEFIRSASEFLVDAGGHPMAAGFTIETSKIEIVQKRLEELALKQVTKKMLSQTLRIDLELSLDLVTSGLYDVIQKLAPFGMGNPVPVFVSKDVVVEDLRSVGAESKHLRLRFKGLDGIWFNAGDRAKSLEIGDKVNLVYTIDQDLWNGNKRLQLKVKDIRA